jgi:formylglycine-generating enzyme required for sulfatase activity
MQHLKRFFYVFVCSFMLGNYVHANNISVSNISVAGQGSASGYALVKFTLSWENSWRTSTGPSNWDAAWVFIKYRKDSGEWKQAWLNNTGHIVVAGSSVNVGLLTPSAAYNDNSNPGLGAFVYRSTDGSGNYTANVELRWNYGIQGLDQASIIDLKVVAVEMVYVTQGDFNVGGGDGNPHYTSTTINTATATTASTGTGSLGGKAGGYPTSTVTPSSATWPNGWSAFYCMKYEVSQQQYVDFLNTLTYAQQVTRTSISPTSAPGTSALALNNENRNGIDVEVSGNSVSGTPAKYGCNLDGDASYGEANDGGDIACNYIMWPDLTAFLDWAGLRPMTELEFEKACRGKDQPAVMGEFAWGNSSATAAISIGNSGTASETAGNSGANAVFGSQTLVNGPLRVGSFAGATTNRAQAGASYYGIMDLSGNLWDRAVTTDNIEGRTYAGTHGNGMLTTNGEADAVSWPDNSGLGSGYRGGDWINPTTHMRVSDRNAASFPTNYRALTYGGRGLRSIQ